MRDAALAIVLTALLCGLAGFIIGAVVATAADPPSSYSQCPKEPE